MKKEILLSQQTPMWHFQSDQEGCCLRATEVKPKLDRFLLKKDGETFNKYRLNDTNALDYKLSFIALGTKTNYTNSKFPLFFGAGKDLISYEHEIKMSIFSLHDDLITKMSKYLCEFFATHSFGTRQDKGFGFFYPKDEIQKIDDKTMADYGAMYKFTTTKTDFESLFLYIYYFHKLIRSGINESGCYYKSLMYFYAKEKGVLWDKATIRHHFQLYNDVYQSMCGLQEGKKYFYRESMETEYNECRSRKLLNILFRDALGLSSRQQWKSYHNTIVISSPEIKRFKSPIIYRPVAVGKSYVVYIFFDTTSIDVIRGKDFTVRSNGGRGYSAPMKMTISRGFSLEEYFKFIKDKGLSLLNERIIKNKYVEEIFGNDKNGNPNFTNIKR